MQNFEQQKQTKFGDYFQKFLINFQNFVFGAFGLYDERSQNKNIRCADM
jgi:hypothetical protein